MGFAEQSVFAEVKSEVNVFPDQWAAKVVTKNWKKVQLFITFLKMLPDIKVLIFWET